MRDPASIGKVEELPTIPSTDYRPPHAPHTHMLIHPPHTKSYIPSHNTHPNPEKDKNTKTLVKNFQSYSSAVHLPWQADDDVS